MGYPPTTFYFKLQPGTPARLRSLADCDPQVPGYSPNFAHPGWPWVFNPNPVSNKISITGPYPKDVTVTGVWKDFGRDLVSYNFQLEHPDGTVDQLAASNFAPRKIEPSVGTWSVTASITGTGTWILWRIGADAGGHVAEHPYYIYAT